jgi:ribosomal protein S20
MVKNNDVIMDGYKTYGDWVTAIEKTRTAYKNATREIEKDTNLKNLIKEIDETTDATEKATKTMKAASKAVEHIDFSDIVDKEDVEVV